ncbi:hypothetical protein HFP57_16085 [Parasphingopyxis algicola]|uniref:hypothetical protein n=1 Tax=Parasphingopyxis algicola TaxID=2026624 RepID=UPI0015A03BE6|nr:hypothetical protein [Parasphingopyxis algicola]QLC26399.1 hypothetical protein HFP57_16085 [Parasphingopyxis algicola]
MSDRAKIDEETKYVQDLPGFKRTNPHYFSDPMIDRLLEIILLMGGEIWSLRHRQAITEKLLASGEPVSPDIIETFKPDDGFKELMENERQDLIKRMFASLAGGQFPDPKAPGFTWVTNPGEDKD